MSENDDGGFFHNNTQKTKITDNDSLLLPVNPEFICRKCGGGPILTDIKKDLGIPICGYCRGSLKLITKTDCKKLYALTDAEIMQFKYISKPNTKHSRRNNIFLFVEDEIKNFSILKHGNIECLEKIKNDKKLSSQKLKINKLKNKVKKLKNKVIYRPRTEFHRHEFVQKGNKGVCKCGFEVEQEEIN